jgi:hypothetical protein
MGLINNGKSIPLETLSVIREIVVEIADNVGAVDVHYCTQGGHAMGQNLGPSGKAESVVYQMKVGMNRSHWASVNGAILLEFDVSDGTVCCGRAPQQQHELYTAYPIVVKLGDPDIVEQIVKYIQITTETINPIVVKPTIKGMIKNAFSRWLRGR